MGWVKPNAVVQETDPFFFFLCKSFQVNKEIVSGLKYVQQTFRKGVKSKYDHVDNSTKKNRLLLHPLQFLLSGSEVVL